MNMFKLPTIESRVIALKVLAIVVTLQLFPAPVAYGDINPAASYAKAFESVISYTSLVAQNPFVKSTRRMRVTTTAYTNTVAETDETPCIAASGFNICANPEKKIVAANFLPFHTKVKINGEFYSVEDHMNSRYNGQNRVDILVQSRDEARKRGITHGVEMEVYE